MCKCIISNWIISHFKNLILNYVLPLLSDISSPVHPVKEAGATTSTALKRSVTAAGFLDNQGEDNFPASREWNMERRLSLDGVTKLDFLATLCLRPATTAPDNRRSKRLKRMEENKSRVVPFPAALKEIKVR